MQLSAVAVSIRVEKPAGESFKLDTEQWGLFELEGDGAGYGAFDGFAVSHARRPGDGA